MELPAHRIQHEAAVGASVGASRVCELDLADRIAGWARGVLIITVQF